MIRRVLKQDFRGKTATAEEYRAAFERERANDYKVMDAIEEELGFTLEHDWLLEAAADLSCPVKRNPPCWQHGRLLYAYLRRYLADNQPFRVPEPTIVEIGTAKGFSACVMAWALVDWFKGRTGSIHSVDMIDPEARVARNTPAELEGLKTVPELVAPFMPPEACVAFYGGGSEAFLEAWGDRRINFAFIDGKHDFEHVTKEARMISLCQKPGDLMIFDDLQFPGVRKAVSRISGYGLRPIRLTKDRIYAVAVKT